MHIMSTHVAPTPTSSPSCLSPATRQVISVTEHVILRFSRFCHTKQWRGLATRFDKHAVIYRAAVVLNAVIAWTRALSDTP